MPSSLQGVPATEANLVKAYKLHMELVTKDLLRKDYSYVLDHTRTMLTLAHNLTAPKQ